MSKKDKEELRLLLNNTYVEYFRVKDYSFRAWFHLYCDKYAASMKGIDNPS